MSDFSVVNASLVLSIPPIFAANPRAGAEELLDSMIMRYIPSLHGVVLSHSNLKFLDKSAHIQDDCPFLVSTVGFDATVWSPRIGSTLSGKINLSSPDHVSLLVHKTFNVSIPRHHIPTDQWEFEYGPAENDPEFGQEALGDDEQDAETKEHQTTGKWIHKLTAEPLGGPSGAVEFTVIGLNNPAALLSSPTETHAAASGIFRSSGSPSWLHEDGEGDDLVSDLSTEEDEEAIEINETFTRDCKLPGTVKVIVETTTFWVHKEILFFSSPFFEAALGGNWSETGRPLSIASTITIPSQYRTDNTSTNVDSDASELESDTAPSMTAQDIPIPSSIEETSSPKDSDFEELLDTATRLPDQPHRSKNRSPPHNSVRRRPRNIPEAVIVLKEEKASTFHDFLRFIYPHAPLVQIRQHVLAFWKRNGDKRITQSSGLVRPPQPSMPVKQAPNPSSQHVHIYVLHIFPSLIMSLSPVFDRMFSLGVRGSGTEAPPLGPRGVTSASSAVVGPRRHFLYCTLKPDSTHKVRKSRE
ncbi:hypothetical protein CVT24_000175 [Panaeolus cyanescens]|uniref:RPA43 OB domain-containing protein n=1 Tax=Panaeolus cyanescens TaxID=181874 RepID=A0A409VWS9_9AGAR|nr:hypothetical protein CVT24_000175 [Panaeolus cyanescens]